MNGPVASATAAVVHSKYLYGLEVASGVDGGMRKEAVREVRATVAAEEAATGCFDKGARGGISEGRD